MDHKEEIRNGCDRGGYTTVGFNATDYDVDTLYDNVSKWKAADLINEINDGIPPNLINHMGHGNWNHFMKLYNYKNKWWEPYPNTHYLHNDEYFFVYSQACIAGSFDNMEGGQEDDTSTWTPHPDKDCVAENLTVEMPYGAFAVIANSRFGFFNETTTNGSSQHFDREFFDALFGEDIRQLGPALQDAKEENIPFIDLPSYRWCYYEINLLGDPEISIRPFPAAKFTHSPQEPYIYKMVTFNASSSYDPDGEIVNYTWDFGDGNISYGEITNHTYFEPGSYEVNLTVTDNDSLGDFKVHAILIKNHPPNTPSNPDSSNGEDSVDTDTDLSWDGGDEDSLDTVTYDIYFGTSSPPPYIDTASYPANQTRITYDLEILDPGTKYYWRIKAKDNHGAQTIGPIWNFITEGPPYIPSNPNPSNGETDVPINQKLYWDGGDPNPSETVTYKVFFDKNPFPPHVATFSRSATEERISYDPGTLNPMTTYYWHISAIDDHGQTINGPPNWNFTTGSEVNHPPEKPSKPSGPTTGYRGETYTYTTSTTDQDEGDQIKYYFDWGDETGTWTGYYNSGQTAHASHSWDSVDTYNVTVKAQDEHEVESDWSDTLSVQIKNRPPYTPSDPDPYDGKTGVEWPDLTLGWCGGDPDPGDTVRYDIYFGTSEDLPDLPCIGNITKDSDVTWITYDVHNLSRLTTYYWKIIAKDNHNGTTEGPLWQFTTKLFKNNNA
jgi:PKD repeat protein